MGSLYLPAENFNVMSMNQVHSEHWQNSDFLDLLHTSIESELLFPRLQPFEFRSYLSPDFMEDETPERFPSRFASMKDSITRAFASRSGSGMCSTSRINCQRS